MENIVKKIYERQGLYRALLIVSKIIVLITVSAFFLILRHAYTLSYTSLIKVLVICGVPFVIVSLARRLISLPRPYEVYTFFKQAPKKKSGSSFPSRHAFSVFIIGTVMMFAYPVIGAVLLLAGITLCVCRVLTGIHFIRDVVAGAILGVISGIVGVLFTSPFI